MFQEYQERGFSEDSTHWRRGPLLVRCTHIQRARAALPIRF
jgi:hypothetical protein